MELLLNHNLPQEKAVSCAEKIFSELSVKFKDEFSNLKQERDGNKILFSFKIRGMNISGKMTVKENEVLLESKLPFAARMFKGMIEDKIKENADKMLEECKEEA